MSQQQPPGMGAPGAPYGAPLQQLPVGALQATQVRRAAVHAHARKTHESLAVVRCSCAGRLQRAAPPRPALLPLCADTGGVYVLFLVSVCAPAWLAVIL
jgi:hypothetical protein